jgi:ribosomal protein L13
MRPKNTSAGKMMTRVKVFAGEADKGTLAAQKPVEIKL